LVTPLFLGIEMKYHLTGKITPKARPRLSKGHAYLPSKYRDWKESAILELRNQPAPVEPIERCQISIIIGGKQTGDLDNIAGSCLDCLTQSGIIKDDRLSVVYRLSIEHQPSQPPGALISID
jgi:Holliday junction resolvase RusA-like endonuclease